MFKRPSIPSLKCDFERLETLHRKQFCLWGEFVLFLTQNLSKIFNTRSSFNKNSSVLETGV